MPDYDASGYHPPAPTAPVTVYDPTTRACVAGVSMLVDTGADVTLIPRAAIERLGVTPEADLEIESIGFDGTRSPQPL